MDLPPTNAEQIVRYIRKLVLSVSALTALVLPASVMMPLSASASGATGLTCAKVKGNSPGSLTVLKCGPFPNRVTAKQYKMMSAPATSFLDAFGFLGNVFSATWSNGTYTRLGVASIRLATSSCPTRDVAEEVLGLVLGGNAAVTSTGQEMTMTVCLSPKGRISLEPGTSVSFHPYP